MNKPTNHFYEFGSLTLDTTTSILYRGGVELPLQPRLLKTLIVLVENSNTVVEREALIHAVWGETVVEEGGLKRNISMLRKALGDESRFIETLPKRGYRFTAEVKETWEDLAARPNSPGRELVLERQADLRITHEAEITNGSTEMGKSLRSVLRPRVWLPSLLLVAMVVSGIALFQQNRTNARNVAAIKSIAVLPLKSFAESTDDRALSLGFADALITSLGEINQVRVISINSVNRYADVQKEPWEIGKELGVDTIFDGTMQKANGKLRVTLRMLLTRDGKQIWSASFDENESEIFHLQDAMATQAAKALAFNLQPQDAKRHTENRDAYQAYLRGRFFFDRRTPNDYKKAVAEFARATALDPNYALLYTGLADIYAMQANDENGEEREALYEKSRTTATRALELDEGLAEAHTSLGWVKRLHDWDWAGSEREFKRALELNPNDVNAHQWYALLLATLGRLDEALSEIEQARDLAPLSKIVLRNYSSIRQFRREFERLPALAEQIVSLDDSQPANAIALSIAYTRTGNYAKAIETGEAYQASLGGIIGSSYIASIRAVAYARMGQDARSREMLEYLEKRARDDSENEYRLAMANAELGRAEQAIKHLQRCFSVHDDRLVWLPVEPCFDSLRTDARFQELLRKMKL